MFLVTSYLLDHYHSVNIFARTAVESRWLLSIKKWCFVGYPQWPIGWSKGPGYRSERVARCIIHLSVWSALMTTSLFAPFCTFIFFERSSNVLSLSFVIFSGNFTLGGSDSSWSLANVLEAFSPKASTWRSFFNSGVASLPLDSQTRSCSLPLEGLIQPAYFEHRHHQFYVIEPCYERKYWILSSHWLSASLLHEVVLGTKEKFSFLPPPRSL